MAWRPFLVCGDVLRGYGSSSYMKVIRSRSRSQQQKVWNSLFSQCKSSTSNNCGSVEDRAAKFAYSVGFWDMADRMVWPPSLSRDRKYMHSRVACLRLECNPVVGNCNVYRLIGVYGFVLSLPSSVVPTHKLPLTSSPWGRALKCMTWKWQMELLRHFTVHLLFPSWFPSRRLKAEYM